MVVGQAVVDEALRRLEERGAVLLEVEVPRLAELNAAVSLPVALFETGTDLPVYLDANGTGLMLEQLASAIASPDVRGLFEQFILGSEAIPESVYRDAIDVHRPRLQAASARRSIPGR